MPLSLSCQLLELELEIDMMLLRSLLKRNIEVKFDDVALFDR